MITRWCSKPVHQIHASPFLCSRRLSRSLTCSPCSTILERKERLFVVYKGKGSKITKFHLPEKVLSHPQWTTPFFKRFQKGIKLPTFLEPGKVLYLIILCSASPLSIMGVSGVVSDMNQYISLSINQNAMVLSPTRAWS